MLNGVIAWFKQSLMQTGHGMVLLGKATGWVLKNRIRWNETWVQMSKIGVESIPMVLLLSCIGGGVLSLQLSRLFANSGTEQYIGGLVALSVVREIAPIFTALAVGARCGTAMASELAHMSLNNQVSALKVLQVSASRYLVTPRLLACLYALPLLNLLACIGAVIAGMVVARMTIGLHYAIYLDSVWNLVMPREIWVSLFKTLVFGLLMATTACTLGLQAQGGSKAVGLAAMKAAVWISILVLLMDFFLSWVFLKSPFDV
jgi:phospholipid/cholesterol/gamma-HCH transport system permease protein